MPLRGASVVSSASKARSHLQVAAGWLHLRPLPEAPRAVTTYTGPERSAELRNARRLRRKVTAAGGCPYCIHAVHGWCRSACDTPGRTFPLCLKTPGIGFEPDEKKLQGESHD